MIPVWIIFGNITTLMSEIDSVMWRNQVEDKFFRFQFFENIGEKVHERMSDARYFEKEGRKYNIKTLKKEVD